MATTTRAGQPQYVEFDEFVDSKLVRTREAIRSTDIMLALVVATAAVLSYLLLFVVADHWLGMDFIPAVARCGIGLTIVGGSLAWAAWRIGLPHRRRINRLFVAREIETHEATLAGNLLNLVDLQQADRTIGKPVMRSIEKRAAVGLSQTDVDGTVDRRPLMRSAYTLLGLVVTACLYTLLTFSLGLKPIGPSLLRAFGAAATAPTRIQFESVEIQVADGDAFVAATDSPRVPARFQPRIKATLNKALEADEHVTLYYSTADQRFVDQPLELRPIDDSQQRVYPEYSVTLIGENDRGLLQDVSFRLEAGDATTDTFTIHVSTAPSATVNSVDYNFPAYMKLAAESRDGGNIDGWEGTHVTVHATASRPVRSARLVFSDTEDTSQRAEEYPMHVKDGTQLSVQWTLSFRSDDPDDHPKYYRIVCQDKQGATDLHPTLHAVAIRPDLPPVVELLDPRADLELPANAVVPLLIQAGDPDFQLKHLTLRVEQDGKQLVEHNRELFAGEQPVFGPTSVDFPLEPLGLQPGQTISYWIEARDNKMPLGNRTNTAPKLNIRITEPVTPEEAKKQRDQRHQQQQEKIRQDQEQQEQQNRDQQEQPPQGGDTTNNPDGSDSTDKSDDNGGTDNDKSGQDGKPQEGDSPAKGDKGKPGDKDGDAQTDRPKGGSGDKPPKPSDDQKGDSPGRKSGTPSQDAAGQKGDSRKDSESKSGSGQPDPDAEAKPLSNDGTDDDEAIQRIRDFQKRQDGQKASGEADGSDSPDDKTTSPDADSPKGQPQRPKPSPDASRPRKDKTDPKGSGQSQETPDKRSADSKKGGEAGSKKREGATDPKTGAKKPSGQPADKKAASKPKDTRGTEPDGSKSDPKSGRGKQSPKKGSGKSGGSKTNKGSGGQKGEGAPKGGGKPKGDDKPSDGSDPSAKTSGGGKKGSPSENGDPKNAKPGDAKGKTGRSQKKKGGGDGKKGGKDGKKSGEGGKKGGKGKQDGSEASAKKPGGKPGDKPSNKPGSKGGEGASGKEAVEGTGGSGSRPGSARQGDDPGNDTDKGDGKRSGIPDSEPVNEAFSKEAANLVLRRIEDQLQRGKVDPDLLKELGWNAGDVKKFADRLRDQVDTPASDGSPEAQAKRRQFEDLLKSINIKSGGTKRTGRSKRQRKTDSINAQDVPVPLQFREAVKLYRRNLSRRSTRSPMRPRGPSQPKQ